MNSETVIYQILMFLVLFLGPTKKMNLFQSLTDAMDIALATDSTAGVLLIELFILCSFNLSGHFSSYTCH